MCHPNILVGALFWVAMYFGAPRPLPLGVAIANFIASVWAYLALWDFDQYLPTRPANIGQTHARGAI